MSKIVLADVGERAIIRKFIHPLSAKGRGNIGDDCAVVDLGGSAPLLLSMDQGPPKSFLQLLKVGTPEDLAHFHVTINVSDIAAMGGIPIGILLALAFPGDTDLSFLEKYMRGFSEALNEYNIELWGGDTKEVFAAATTISIIGKAHPKGILFRMGARPGDKVFVSGPPIGSVLKSYILAARASPHTVQVLRPKAQVALAQRLVELGACSSCMDMSDGLLASASQLGEASECVIALDYAKIQFATSPVQDANRWIGLVSRVGGDFGLMFTVAPSAADVVRGLGAVEVGVVKARSTNFKAYTAASSWEQFTTIGKISDEILSFV